jgi:hypothetical protein
MVEKVKKVQMFSPHENQIYMSKDVINSWHLRYQSQPPPAKAGGLNIFGDLSRLWSV